MYTVVPASGWDIAPNRAITARQIAQLTTYMRQTLYDAMGAAVDDARATSSINSRKGTLFNSLRTGRRQKGTGTPSTISVTFMFRPWMAIHETGGDIVPKNGKYLILPMPAAMRADGSMKRRNANGWRSYGAFVLTSKSGKKYVVYRSKTTKQLVFLYHLVDKVTLKKRLDLRGAIMRQENEVVTAWSNYVMQIFSDVDMYGMAFEGLRIS